MFAAKYLINTNCSFPIELLSKKKAFMKIDVEKSVQR